jgi:serine/threonine protein kinase
MGLAPGSRLGRYRIVRQLGAGAMGEVYLAEDPQIERSLAIKTVRLDVQEQAGDLMRTQIRQRFEREAKAAGRLVHPHIVTLFDAGPVDDVFYLAFEYVDGPNLGERVKQQPPLTLNEILRMAREAASALDAAHRVGIVHRDIKPANLMLSTERGLKIADFGIATLVGQSTLTQTGFLVGTPQYLSPEQVRGDVPLDGRSDLFSLGVVLYELLAGHRPFDSSTMASLLYAIMSKEPTPLGELRPDLPERLSAAVMRLLAKEPDQRFPNAAALGEELMAVERALAEPRPSPSFEPPPLPEPTPRTEPPPLTEPAPLSPVVAVRRRRGTTAAALITLLVLLAGVAAIGYRAIDWSPETTTTSTVAGQNSTFSIEPPSIGGSTTVADTVESTTTAGGTSTETASTATVTEPTATVVGGVLTVRVFPPDAAGRAVVKIDGLVRGLASGSVMTLRPGRHELEVVAEGFEPAKLLIESRDEPSAPGEVEVRLQPR